MPRQSLGIKCGVYAAYFFEGIATLALAMTRKSNCHCGGAWRPWQTPGRENKPVIARHEVPRQSLGIKCGVYAAYFFEGIATLALAMTRKFNCHCEGAERPKQARQPVPLSSRYCAPPPPFHRGSLLPGGWRSTDYMLRTFSLGYFAYAQYDVKSSFIWRVYGGVWGGLTIFCDCDILF